MRFKKNGQYVLNFVFVLLIYEPLWESTIGRERNVPEKLKNVKTNSFT